MKFGAKHWRRKRRQCKVRFRMATNVPASIRKGFDLLTRKMLELAEDGKIPRVEFSQNARNDEEISSKAKFRKDWKGVGEGIFVAVIEAKVGALVTRERVNKGDIVSEVGKSARRDSEIRAVSDFMIRKQIGVHSKYD